MAAGQDYYNTLGIARTATDDAIRKAHRALARKYHPDVSTEPEAQKRFAEVQEAYDVLSDTEKRQAYDRGDPTGMPSGGGWQQRGPGGPSVDPGDFQDIFEEMFGAGGPRGTAGGSPFSAAAQPRPRPRRGGDRSHSLTVTFMTAAKGGEETIKLDDGSTVSLRIPAGIDDGGRLRVRDKGVLGSGGGARGDLIVTIRVGGHPWFRRSGLDLLLDVPVSIVEATRGTSISMPLLNGRIDLRIPAGSNSGQRLRIAKQGLESASGDRGDFYAVVQIKAPEGPTLSDAAQNALDTLSAEVPNPRLGLEAFA
jgi:DnaJ-class molecular chaperone